MFSVDVKHYDYLLVDVFNLTATLATISLL